MTSMLDFKKHINWSSKFALMNQIIIDNLSYQILLNILKKFT